MADAVTDLKQHAHELIERMASGRISEVVELLETMLDPVSAAWPMLRMRMSRSARKRRARS